MNGEMCRWWLGGSKNCSYYVVEERQIKFELSITANEAGNIAYDWNILEAQTYKGLRRRQIHIFSWSQ